MKPEDFEKRLQSQPMRQIPTEWRKQILRGATPARPSFLSTLNHQLSTILWPNPKAWAGLAAVWIAIFALQSTSHSGSRMVASAPAPHRYFFGDRLKDEQQTLVELMGNNQPVDADQPRNAGPKPHSERAKQHRDGLNYGCTNKKFLVEILGPAYSVVRAAHRPCLARLFCGGIH